MAQNSKIEEAIRVGCSAADIHLACSYPACSCKQMPRAIQAAIDFLAAGRLLDGVEHNGMPEEKE